ncbi:MAG TPA: hypothetical protein VFR47_09415 [Anaerolineales bacterium]|nr:hypothetical protein [Anaerolineales bacterium]
MLADVLVTNGKADGVVVRDSVRAGNAGEDDNVASALIWEVEQAVREKRKKVIRNFFKLLPPVGSEVKNP